MCPCNAVSFSFSFYYCLGYFSEWLFFQTKYLFSQERRLFFCSYAWKKNDLIELCERKKGGKEEKKEGKEEKRKESKRAGKEDKEERKQKEGRRQRREGGRKKIRNLVYSCYFTEMSRGRLIPKVLKIRVCFLWMNLKKFQKSPELWVFT